MGVSDWRRLWFCFFESDDLIGGAERRSLAAVLVLFLCVGLSDWQRRSKNRRRGGGEAWTGEGMGRSLILCMVVCMSTRELSFSR